MENSLAAGKDALQDCIDDIISPHSSNELKLCTLRRLERQLAKCAEDKEPEALHNFFALQHTFECNIPSRLLPWLSGYGMRIEVVALKGLSDNTERRKEATELSSQIASALTLIQGIALKHGPTKVFLGRNFPIQSLVDLLLISRHLSSIPSKTNESPATLSASILDTLLCILVDSPTALRTFEECKGLQAVVKILKRAGTPREVRMKCLEFLYFYLLDETKGSMLQPQPELAPTAPSPPISFAGEKKPFFAGGPRRPVSRYGSSTYSLAGTSSDLTNTSSSSFGSSTSSKRSTSSSSSQSFSSTSSNISQSTAASTRPPTPSSPKKLSSYRLPQTPLVQKARPMQSRTLMMLKKEVDFEPLSPQRSAPEESAQKNVLRSRLGSFVLSSESQPESDGAPDDSRPPERKTRSIEEKKEMLGTMLGNVDALVESVRKAGIWGLG